MLTGSDERKHNHNKNIMTQRYHNYNAVAYVSASSEGPATLYDGYGGTGIHEVVAVGVG